ncbi:monoamine oxidase [Pontibacter ummariensis]|uniref:Monoamine oxidase n=1 Tax=Pontibacter ummariensis TaxID=1610492 RepID=A0A239D319_9BACT|nr:FAD-dependent oxidoreductase [Pontibacter ummariensis]PRY14222.1 monoamine oxidase [Pontibacter ummariensis]SNS26805.1 monoamine oxidase [Pontibacter ummariensis]
MVIHDVIIVGAGLSGLSAAYYLEKAGIDALLLEARERLGGRILTVAAEGNACPVEMGATWFADKHEYLIRLLQELQLPFYEQYQQGLGVFEANSSEPPQLFELPSAAEPSYRVRGGTSKLIEALVSQVGKERVALNCPATKVSEHENYLEVECKDGTQLYARHLISTVPPFLLAKGVEFTPALPEEVRRVMQQTHTWMGEALKFGVAYARPFWRERGYAGTLFSQTGIVQEAYDHTDQEKTRFSLKGFLAAGASALGKKEREAQVLSHLRKLLGSEAAGYLSYTEKVWQEEKYTYAPYGQYILRHLNNGHPLYALPLMNGRLHLSGTETSPGFGGYMDGAVYSGIIASSAVAERLKKG